MSRIEILHGRVDVVGVVVVSAMVWMVCDEKLLVKWIVGFIGSSNFEGKWTNGPF